jgi:hypothetical protein
MSFFEFLEEVEKEFFDYLEYLEVNNLSYDENGNIVEKGSSLTLKPGNNSDKHE